MSNTVRIRELKREFQALGFMHRNLELNFAGIASLTMDLLDALEGIVPEERHRKLQEKVEYLCARMKSSIDDLNSAMAQARAEQN